MRAFPTSKLVILIGALTLIAAASISQAAGGEAVGSKIKRVSVRDDLFSPRSVSVSRGDKVIWSWRGDNPHNVRFRSVPRRASKRGSDTQSSGRFARTFDRRGTYRYVCTIHQDAGMKGSVNVD